jgi:hypothetical protein
MSDDERRPNVTDSAPVGCVDVPAFDPEGNSYEITACPYCLPWRAELVRDPETDEILVREWHAVDCGLFRDLIDDPRPRCS